MNKVIIFIIIVMASVTLTKEHNQHRIRTKEATSINGQGKWQMSASRQTTKWHGTFVRRRRRAVQYCRMTFINKSGLEVNVFYMNRFGYRRRYFVLRRNERMIVRSKVGTTWLAYDVHNTQTLLLNKNYNFLVYHKHLNKDIDIIVTTRAFKKAEPPQGYNEEKFVEVMVIADWTVVKKHGQKTEKYILTMMNAVNRLFQDKSFGINLRIAVTRIKLLNDKTESEENLKLVANAPTNAMRNACSYAGTLNNPSDQHQDHFDFAVILTRMRFGYSGYTPIFRMCDVHLGCTLVLERGLQIAHVIAHEIGHSLGIDHDGENNDCVGDGPKGSLMGPTLWSRFDHYYWSKCTSRQIKETVGYFTCLNDRPQSNITKFAKNLPGIHFDMDEQCKFYLGNHYRGCKGFNFRNDCRYLYCAPHWLQAREDCVRYYLPPLDGTPCKNGNHWCVKGNCFPYGQFNFAPVHGGWSKWASWTGCSSECGIGLRYRVRSCDNPSPKYEGKYCKGYSKEKRACNLKECDVLKTEQERRNNFCNTLQKGNWHWYTKAEMHMSVAKIQGLNCSFEKDSCSWTQEKDDDFDWLRHKGHTPSMGTGPSFDHTFHNDSGHYMYIEASDEAKQRRRNGHKARMKSPVISAPEICFRFYYHLLGSHIGALNIYKLSGNKTEMLWNRTKPKEDLWLQASLNIASTRPYHIIIEGVRGIHYQGDIAIDDISITAGKCDEKHQTGGSECTITCANDNGNEYTPGTTLPDTYKCYTDHRHDICVNGVCEKLGCDMKFGSNMTKDNCQICGGKNTNCTLFEGTETISSNDIVEDTLMTFSPSSTNVHVVVMIPLNASIGLRHPFTDKTVYQQNTQKSLHSKHFTILGSGYTIERGKENGIMIVKSDGPTNGFVDLVVAGLQNSNLTIHYQFFKSKFRYEWMTKIMTNCSKDCQEPTPVCVQLPTGLESNQFQCPQKLPEASKCLLGNCMKRYAWKTSKWSRCNRPCGLAAKIRKVTCMEIQQHFSVNVVDDKNCVDEKPATVAYCRGQPCKIRVRKCREKSPLCPRLKRKGVCGYSNVKKMCCKTCA